MRTGIIVALAAAMATVAADTNGTANNPKIEVENGVLAIKPAEGSHAHVKGELRASTLTLQETPGASVVDVKDSLTQCRSDTAALALELSTQMSTAHSTMQSTVTAAVTEAVSAMQANHDQLDTNLRAHAVELVQQVNDNTSTAMVDQAEETLALFEEASTREAGVWEYSYSGNANINQNFAYWFSIDHGGQGAANNSHGIGDSYHCGNWFLEVEAKSGHCGGGCHVNYFNQRLYLNGYCSKSYLWNRNINNNHGNVWSVDRVKDGHNGHNDVCHTFKVKHNAGRYGFGGPYFIRIRSTKPLVALHTHPWGSCTFIRTGINTGVRPRRTTVYQSRNCPGHRAPPGECRTGTPAGNVLGIRTDPTDPLYNNTLFRGSCCVAGTNCPR
jgi:hypothetical protein